MPNAPERQDKPRSRRNNRRKNDVATMETRYAAGYREPEPSAARFRRARRIDAVEALEDTISMFGRYSYAMVFNRYRKAARRARNGNGDVGRTRMAYRVRDEIANRLAD